MTRLLDDRYYVLDDEHRLDLATGDVEAGGIEAGLGRPASGEVPAGIGRPSRITSFIALLLELLDHGRDGEPRRVTLDVAGRIAAAIDRAADAGRARGYVPIAAAVYFSVRDALADELRERSLLLIAAASPADTVAHAAFLDAAARSARPHALVVLCETRRSRPAGERARHLWMVREAHLGYRVPHAHTVALPADAAHHVARGARAGEFVRAGRHAAAERLLRDVAASLARRDAAGPAAQALIALGRLLLERGRPGDADEAFHDAATHAAGVRDEALTAVSRIWQAAARTDAGQLTAAEALARAAVSTSAGRPEVHAHGAATLARILLWQRRVEEAVALDLRLPDSAAEAFPFIAATKVRVLVAAGRLFEAGTVARQLLEAIAPGDDPQRQVIAHAAHLRVLLAAGDFTLAAERMAAVRQSGKAARTPLRIVRARVLLAEALLRAGRTREAAIEVVRLGRLRDALPPLLREAIDALAKRPQAPPPRRPAIVADCAAALVTLAQNEAGDEDAVRKALEMSARALDASRVELLSCDAGPASTLVGVGAGLATRLGGRILETGIPIGPESDDPGREMGVPVRIGVRLIAALCARWPIDRTPAAHGHHLLELAAAAIAPRVDAMLAHAREIAGASTAVPELVGSSLALDEVRRAIARAAPAPFAVLIEGESGVGKELVARAIHALSRRRERRFCDINCAALPDELLESELFGHARGAFTGALADRAGLIEEADGGTLFLDEVADLSARAQAKLLRVIQQQEVRRVGETFTRPVDIRIVSAANRDMRVEADQRRFRQDLLYRLDVIRLRIPPLRERPEDIPLLVEHFWRRAAARVGTSASLAHGTLTALTRYHWPGNVRELQNVMAALAVAAPSRGQVRPSSLPPVMTMATAVTSGRLADARAQFERRFVEIAVARAGGSRSQAARELGLSRQGLLKMMERLGVDGSVISR